MLYGGLTIVVRQTVVYPSLSAYGRLTGPCQAYVMAAVLTEAAIAAMAAQKLGRFWPYLLGTYKRGQHHDAKALSEQARKLGLDPKRFASLSKDQQLRKLLVASKKEGVRHKVEATPTLFINGRRYVGDLDLATVVDVLEEEHDRVTGRR